MKRFFFNKNKLSLQSIKKLGWHVSNNVRFFNEIDATQFITAMHNDCCETILVRRMYNFIVKQSCEMVNVCCVSFYVHK